MDYFSQKINDFIQVCDFRKLLYLCLVWYNCRFFTCCIMKSGPEKKNHKHFIKVTRQWSTMYLACKNMLLDSIYHEKLLDCEEAEMAAWQECSCLVLIILSVDLPSHPKPCINSGGELRWTTQRHQKIQTEVFSLTLATLHEQTHITVISKVLTILSQPIFSALLVIPLCTNSLVSN